jgi:CBS domain-containing protein
MSTRNQSLLELFPWVLKELSPAVNESLQLMSAGILMAFRRIYFLPVVRDARVVGRFDGEKLVRVLEKVRDGGPWRLVAYHVGDVYDKVVPEVGSKDSLSSLVSSMAQQRYGHGCVVEDGKLIATISLRDFARYFSSIGVSAGVKVGEFAQPIISLPAESTTFELLGTLLSKRIRRVVVSGMGKRLLADDRLVVQSAFSNEGLVAIKYATKAFFERHLSELELMEPGTISGDQDLAEAWKMIYANPAQCLLVDANGILTPWDAFVTPYVQGRLTSISKEVVPVS